MLTTYFKIAWRNITRHKVYTTINVLGLALGICACMVIFLITRYEFSFDRFHPDEDRIYRIVGEMQKSSGEKEFVNSVYSDVAGFQTQIPGFESTAGFYDFGVGVTIPDGKKPAKNFDNHIEGTYSPAAIITWPQYFDVFRYQWLAGNVQSLNEPFKVVLSVNRARKYFGDIPPEKMIGRTVIYSDSLRVNVSGIVKDWTENTDLGYTDFVSISTATHSFLKSEVPTEDWTPFRPHGSMAWVKLSKGVTAASVNNRFAAFIKDHVKMGDHGAKLRMYLQPLSSIHFTTDFHRGDDGDGFRKPYMPTLYVLIGVALFILLIAAVNFINLATAQSIKRAKEIGVRKVLGSKRINIVIQFLTETFVLTFLAVILSALLMRPTLYLFREYVPEGVAFHLLESSTLLFLLIVTILTTLLAGFYPAKVLASYLPVLSLKGASFQKGTEKLNLRRALIVFQFTISLLFIIGALGIGRQMSFMKKADKGFNPDAVITINNWSDHEGKTKVFAQSIKQLKGVDKVLLQGNAPMGLAQITNTYTYKGKEDISVEATAELGDDEYLPFYQLKLIAGRNMVHSDSLNEMVINETLSKRIGFKDPHDAVGKMLYSTGGATPRAYPIVGVVADFHQGSFHEAIRPAIIENMPEYKNSVAVKLAMAGKDPDDVKAVLSQVGAQWKKIYPDKPFDYNFLNESITALYGQEKKTAWLVNVAMSITIFISCMGLFGLSLFTAERRTKEIGIRKVLGASISNIVALLSRDFVVLVVIAFVIAAPVAWYFMNQWLNDFAYRTHIDGWVFLLAGTSALLIAVLTVSGQAIRAAIANPVNSLRNE